MTLVCCMAPGPECAEWCMCTRCRDPHSIEDYLPAAIFVLGTLVSLCIFVWSLLL